MPHERLAALNLDLEVGSSGADVRALHAYLGAFGYFPNAELASRYPAWKPIVPNGPADLSVYDEATASAVTSLQARSGLMLSGRVDAATRAVLATPRCGVPDGITAPDPSEKFGLTGGKWPREPASRYAVVKWKLTNTNDVSWADARAAIQAAANTWSQFTNVSFVDRSNFPSETVRVTISFAELCGAGALACSGGPPGNVVMSIHPSLNWSVATPTPAGKADLQSVVTHELGHALGLWHSDVGGAIMGPGGNGTRVLSTDDKFGISALYDWPTNLVGAGIDIAVGSTPRLFMLGNGQSGDNPVFQMTANGWQGMTTGAGVRISVAGASSPVIVNAAGQVFQHSFMSGAIFQPLPGVTAKDVGGSHNGSIWVVGSSPKPGGFGLLRWNGSAWIADNQNVGGVRIAVDSLGVPWIVTSAGDVMRKSHASPTEGAWGTLPRPPGSATDIGVSTRPVGNRGGVAWVIAGNTVYAWNGQDQTLGTDANGKTIIVIPGAEQWVPLFGGVATGPRTGIATNIYGDLYVAQNSGALTTTMR